LRGDSKGAARTDKRHTGRALMDARKRFVHVYNNVAKPLVRGVLGNVDRGDEFRHFFLDLQLNEGSNAGRTESQPAPTTGDPSPSGEAPAPSTAPASGQA
jgi:hypothetical protein